MVLTGAGLGNVKWGGLERSSPEPACQTKIAINSAPAIRQPTLIRDLSERFI